MGMISECCSGGWDEDRGICLVCKEHSGGVHNNDYEPIYGDKICHCFNEKVKCELHKPTPCTFCQLREELPKVGELGGILDATLQWRIYHAVLTNLCECGESRRK